MSFAFYAELVTRGLLTRTQLIDAIAVFNLRQDLFRRLPLLDTKFNYLSGAEFTLAIFNLFCLCSFIESF
jgi:hypothetical protein